jgi:hypothetical protein
MLRPGWSGEDVEQVVDLAAGQRDHAVGGGWRARSVAARTARKALASMARVVQPGAPGRIRTRDPLLRRHIQTVVVRRLTSLYELSNSSYCRWPSDGVARRLSLLAPLLAPQKFSCLR